MNEHGGYKEIYLEPDPCANRDAGAMWCEDNQKCDNCGEHWIKHVRAVDIENEVKKLNKKLEK